METILVKIFATALALSEIMTGPQTVKTHRLSNDGLLTLRPSDSGAASHDAATRPRPRFLDP